MKQREIKELHMKTADELRTMLKDIRNSLVSAKLDHVQRKLSNTTSLTQLRTDMARIQTVMKEKMREAESVVKEETAAKAGGKA